MAILGLGSVDDKPATKKKQAKKAGASDDGKPSNAQADEAKALLEKMNAKADADECPFC